jgi:hypothetical protein
MDIHDLRRLLKTKSIYDSMRGTVMDAVAAAYRKNLEFIKK